MREIRSRPVTSVRGRKMTLLCFNYALLYRDRELLCLCDRLFNTTVQCSGTRIPKGELVLAALGSANHDESKFQHPETLILDRPNNQHYYPMHKCMGLNNEKEYFFSLMN